MSINGKKGIFSLLICIMANVLFPGQVPAAPGTRDSTHTRGTDTAFIQDYKEKLTGRLFLLFQNAGLAIWPGTDQEVVFRPNVFIRTGIAGFYKWFGLGLSINNPIYRFSEEKYGKTSSIDLRVNAYGKSVIAELFLQNFKGFFTGNLKDSGGNYYQSPGMGIFSFGASVTYIYNSNRFSSRAAFIQNERQKKSAGSLMVNTSLTYYAVSSDGTIFPEEVISLLRLRDSQLVTDGNFYSLGLSPGYTYTVVFLKNFYLNAAILPGVLWQYYEYKTKMAGRSNMEFSLELSARFAVGYNSEKWFLGAGFILGNNEIPVTLSQSSFYYDVMQIRLWGGTRFNWFNRKK